jgi:hypothetical protein
MLKARRYPLSFLHIVLDVGSGDRRVDFWKILLISHERELLFSGWVFGRKIVDDLERRLMIGGKQNSPHQLPYSTKP